MLDYPLTKLRVILGPETLLGPGKADRGRRSPHGDELQTR
jgi:hypothetical protein